MWNELPAKLLAADRAALNNHRAGCSVVQALPLAVCKQPQVIHQEKNGITGLWFVLGKYPVPSVFARVTSARPPSDYHT
jgi:hypothetical protein